jgi:DNA-binding NarL/FixJ family response regulator
MKTIRLVVVDDHDLVRAGFRSLLKDEKDIVVVGEAADGREALKVIAHHRPDVVLMDIMMPEMNGLDAAAHVTSQFPMTRVIILSMSASPEYVLQALRAGASGFLLKNITPTELIQAIRDVARGEASFTPAVARHVIAGFLNQINTETTSLDRLTPRQREVLQLVAEGNTSKEIAKKLGISVKTAEMHRSELMKTLDMHDVASLVRYAIRMGVIGVED